mgnify:CR=1 FL=1
MDLFASIFLVIALASTVGVKYGTTVRTIRLREKLIEAESAVRTARAENLKVPRSRKRPFLAS